MSSPATDPVALLERAATDGHAWLPRSLVDPVVPSAAMAAAVGSGAVVPVGPDGPDGEGWALASVAEAEELLADGLAALAHEGRLAVVAGPPGVARDEAVTHLRDQAQGSGARVAVVEPADRLDLDAAIEAVEDLPDDALLLLAGDPATLPAAGPGDVLVDLVGWGGCPVVTPPSGPGTDALGRLRAAVRDGGLVAPDPADRSFVVVAVGDDRAAAHRAVQVATLSVPRAFGLTGDRIAVLTPLVRGEAGRDALRTALDEQGAGDVEVLTVAEAAGRDWPAVVLALPPTSAGVLSRAVLVAATTCADRHLTVVHGAGADLARAVATVPRRPRRTRLPALLRSRMDS